MIDPSIITQGAIAAQEQQQRNLAALQDFGGSIGQLFLGRRVAQMRQLGTPEEQQQFANKSIYSRQLNTQRKLDTAEALKIKNAEEDRQYKIKETLANIGKINAESGKIGAEAGKVSTETGGMRYNTATQAWQVAAQYGPNAGKMLLAHQLAAGAIDQPTHDAQVAQLSTLDGLSPEDASNAAYAQFKATLDPKYNFTTPDHMATVGQQRHATNTAAETAEKDRAERGRQFDKGYDLDVKKWESATALGETEILKSAQGYVLYNKRTGETTPATMDGQPVIPDTVKSSSASPIPVGALNKVLAAKENITSIDGGIAKVDEAIQSLGGVSGVAKTIDLGLLNNQMYKWDNATGRSTPASQAYERIESTRKKLANDLLLLANGTQTEGDAQRAAQQILSAPLTDNQVVINAFSEFKKAQQKIKQELQNNVSAIYDNYGRAEPSAASGSAQQNQQAAQGTGGRTMSVADAKRAAAMAKISYADAVKSLAAQGITVK